MIQALHVAGGIVIALLFMLAAAWGAAELTVWREHRGRRREIEAWRRARPRAPLRGFIVATDAATGDRFAIPIFAPGSAARPADADPITGEPIQYGWSQSELREIAARPTEFFV